MCSTNFIRLP
nr:unnamed protein product [Callosobruchus chinensis]